MFKRQNVFGDGKALFTLILLAPFFSIFGTCCQAQPVLTLVEAQIRSRLISNIQYKVHLNLYEKPVYNGTVQISFYLNQNAINDSTNVFLDFNNEQGGTITSIKVNGKTTPFTWHKSKVYIPLDQCKVGQTHTFDIEFSNNISREEGGFHYVQDAQDDGFYIYSSSEPYFANTLFPLFDQPDLKATFELSVTAPASWEVISAAKDSNKQALANQRTLWHFKQSKKISSYAFSIAAGPFASWKSQTTNGIPLRIFVRKSMAQYINSQDWFTLAQGALDYYEKNFNYPYPFEKLDQIIVPELMVNAMENVGAIIYNEQFIVRGSYTPLQRLTFAARITHEIAHMWFGNLVTLKWWDNLWLNESFATFMGYLCLASLQDTCNLPDSWRYFYIYYQLPALIEDAYSTSHPIVMKVADTDQASSNFDKITYGKGATAIKELYSKLGHNTFFKGIANYFKKYSYQNVTLNEFIEELSKASGINLDTWLHDWLQTKGFCEEPKNDTPLQKLGNVWVNVRKGLISAYSFIDETLKCIQDAHESMLVQFGIEKLYESLKYFPPHKRPAMNKKISQWFMKKLMDNKNGDIQEVLFGGYLQFAASHDNVALLKNWLNGINIPAHINIDQDKRCNIIRALARCGAKQCDSIINKEREKDKTNRGVLGAQLAQVSFTSSKNKRLQYALVSSISSMSASNANQLIKAFPEILKPSLTSWTKHTYFEEILSMYKNNQTERHIACYAESLYPTDYPVEFEHKTSRFIKKHPELPPRVVKVLSNCIEDSKRMRMIWAKFA